MLFQKIEEKIAELPLYCWHFFAPEELEFSSRIRWICENECPMYGQSWACPPAVGEVDACKAKCLAHQNCLMIATMAEVDDISNITETLATRPEHEGITNEVKVILEDLGLNPYVLSTEACAFCPRCAYLDGQPCRYPEKMHPCVESHGINVVPVMEEAGLNFQFGQNIVTWVSLLFF